jgi:hypothetical protein
MAAFVTAATVREYLIVTGGTSSPDQYSDSLIGSNIRVASAFLERRSGRQFEAQAAATKIFTTMGAALISIPDLRTATSVTLNGSALTADSTYWLQPDPQESGIYTAIQLRRWGGYDYRSYPDWFDRNLDHPRWRETGFANLPNDLVIVGDWGWGTLPEALLFATKALAAWLTIRPDALLSGVIQIGEGAFSDTRELPPEVTMFLADWSVGPMVVAV